MLQLDLRHEPLEALLNFIYTNECHLTLENVFEIIRAAQLCQMNDLFDYCCDYLGQNLNDENIFQFFHFAKTNSHEKLFSITHHCLMYFDKEKRN